MFGKFHVHESALNIPLYAGDRHRQIKNPREDFDYRSSQHVVNLGAHLKFSNLASVLQFCHVVMRLAYLETCTHYTCLRRMTSVIWFNVSLVLVAARFQSVGVC